MTSDYEYEIFFPLHLSNSHRRIRETNFSSDQPLDCA